MTWVELIVRIVPYMAGLLVVYYFGYDRGHRDGLNIPYHDISKAARNWIQEGGELIKRKWSDCE